MRASLIALVLLTACGSDGPKADAGEHPVPDATPADAGQSCRELQDEYDVALAQVGKTCETIMDCAVVGGLSDGTCNGAPGLGFCSGNATNKLAYRSSRAAEIEAEFDARCAHASCSEVDCIADCAPARNLRCENHVCLVDQASCLVPPADAGVDAAP